jgi:hypothetical protein
MTQFIETATFEALSLRLRGKFENVDDAPLLIVGTCTAPFGVELDSKFAPLPIFAGGSDPRKHLSMQLEISEEAAEGFRRLDTACSELSTMPGTWNSLLTTRDGRHLIKVRIHLDGERATSFRVGEGEMYSGWEHFGPILLEQGNLRGLSLKLAIRPQYVWSVSGKKGLTMAIDQFVIQARAPTVRIDHFA